MKRALTMLLSLCVALLLFGCAGSEEPSGDAGKPSFHATARSLRPIRHSLRQCIPCVRWMKTGRVRRAVGLRIEPAGAAGKWRIIENQNHQPFVENGWWFAL